MPTNTAPTERDVARYYAAALAALRHLENLRPTGRRFGPEADARWATFAGDLTTADRIDLLIRDADAQWPEALGARTTFADRSSAEDMALPPDLSELDPTDAEALWRLTLATPAPASLADLFTTVAAHWGLGLSSLPDLLAELQNKPPDPAERLVVVGPCAIASTALAFQTTRDLDWREQVLIVATPPAHRQLAAIAGAALGITRPAPPLTESDAAAHTPAARRLIQSPDADPADLAAASRLVGHPRATAP